MLEHGMANAHQQLALSHGWVKSMSFRNSKDTVLLHSQHTGATPSLSG